MTGEQFDELSRLFSRSASRRPAFEALAAAILDGWFAALQGGARRGEAVASQTQLKITNSSRQDVQAYITLGVPPNCVNSVASIPFVTTVVNPLQGSFTLRASQSVSSTPPPDLCLNANIAFGTPPINCPTTEFPHGVNLAEFILNNGGQGPFAQETIDDSAVAGVNAFIRFQATGGGDWNAGPIRHDVTEFGNRRLHENAGLVGVFPWGCDDCWRYGWDYL